MFCPTVLLLLTAAQPAPQKTALAWDFTAGKSFHQELTLEVKNVVKVKNREITLQATEKWYSAWTPVRKERNGNWVLKQTLTAVKMDVNAFGTRITIDTTGKGDGEDAFAKAMRGFVGTEFLVTLDPAMRIVAFEGFKERMKKLGEDHPTVAPVLRQTVSEDSFRQWSAVCFGALPGREVRAGDRWTTKSHMALNPVGRLASSNAFTAEQGGRIKARLTLKLEAGPLPAPIKEADYGGEATGELRHDAAKGRLESGVFFLTLKGEIVETAAGEDVTNRVTQDTKINVRFDDKDLSAPR